MTVLGSHVLLGLAVAALAGAGIRLAARCDARGPAAVSAAAAFGCAIAGIEALLLGLVDLGASPIALTLGAAAAWLAARLTLPPGALGAELAAWWAAAGLRRRAVTGSLVVLFAGWVGWQLRYPSLGVDGLVYHLALSGLWVHGGSPGDDVQVIAGVPFGNYPLTNELLTGWALAISRSWVVASVWTPLMAVLLGVSAWVGLRSLDVPQRVAGVAVVALLTLPLVVGQLGSPLTDLAALAWLVTAAALCAASLRDGGRPLLLAPALVAAGLAFGTKTTPAVLLALALGAAAWRHRRKLRDVVAPIAIAAAGAVAVGGVWSIRNLVDHGSPLWPFVATPFGDPVPPRLAEVEASFLDHPAQMLDGRVDDYLLLLAGAAVLIAGAALLPLLRRSRAALASGAAAMLALLAWMAAPYTGIDASTDLAIGATRYLLPAIAAATLAVAVCARGAGRGVRRAAIVTLALATVLSGLRVLSLGFPFRPSVASIAGLLVVGAGTGWALGRVRLPAPSWAAPVAAVAGVAALAAAAPGYVERHGDVGLGDAPFLDTLAVQPGYEGGDRDVAMGPGTNALAGGDRLRHRVPLATADDGCAALRARLDRGWLVLQKQPPTPEYERMAACVSDLAPVWEDDYYELYPPAA
ncbi:MAG: hypothetical protein WD844_03620 [Thermoleophilaceae bacterium]